jgi:hypothetical protein
MLKQDHIENCTHMSSNDKGYTDNQGFLRVPLGLNESKNSMAHWVIECKNFAQAHFIPLGFGF